MWMVTLFQSVAQQDLVLVARLSKRLHAVFVLFLCTVVIGHSLGRYTDTVTNLYISSRACINQLASFICAKLEHTYKQVRRFLVLSLASCFKLLSCMALAVRPPI